MIKIGTGRIYKTQNGDMIRPWIFPEFTSIDLLNNDLLLFSVDKKGNDKAPDFNIFISAKSSYNPDENKQTEQQPQQSQQNNSYQQNTNQGYQNNYQQNNQQSYQSNQGGNYNPYAN